MRDILFQIVLLLIGALIGVTVPLLPRTGQKWAAGVLAILLMSVASAWAVYELATSARQPPVIIAPSPSAPIQEPNPQTSTPADKQPDIVGTPIQTNAVVTSVLDNDSKKQDVYSLTLAAGQELRFQSSSTNGIYLWFVKPGAKSAASEPYEELCKNSAICDARIIATVTGTYLLNVWTANSQVRYKLSLSIIRNIAVTEIASDIPGTELMLKKSIVSVVDTQIKPKDVFSVDLIAGQTLVISTHVITTTSYQAITLRVRKPTVKGPLTDNDLMCPDALDCHASVLAAVNGTYYLEVTPNVYPGIRKKPVVYEISADIEKKQ